LADFFIPDERSGMREPSMMEHETVIPSDFTEADRIQKEIERLLTAREYDERDVFAIRLALDEALVNAVKHGNRMDRSKHVRIAYRLTDEQFEITIEDAGAGFDPDAVADPLASENLERPCGQGLLLMRHYMSAVAFHPPGNKVTMSRHRSPPGGTGHASPRGEKARR
jgi:serine/threonine-protein kinase RsbW